MKYFVFFLWMLLGSCTSSWASETQTKEPTIGDPCARAVVRSNEDVGRLLTKADAILASYRPGKVFTPEEHSVLFQVLDLYRASASKMFEEADPVEEPFSSLRQVLIEANRPLVFFILRDKYKGQSNLLWDDIVGHGELALVRSVDGFRTTKGVQFSSYVGKAVERAYVELLRQIRGNRVKTYTDCARSGNDEGVMLFEEFVEDPIEPTHIIHDADRRRVVLAALYQATADGFERELILEHFGLEGRPGSSLSTLAKKYGYPKPKVLKTVNSVMERMRKLLMARIPSEEQDPLSHF